MTHRQFAAWIAWLSEQWEQPSRTDNYLMQIAAEIRRGNVKKPRSVKIEHMRLRFKSSSRKPKLTREQATALSKAKWLAVVGKPARREQRDGSSG